MSAHAKLKLQSVCVFKQHGHLSTRVCCRLSSQFLIQHTLNIESQSQPKIIFWITQHCISVTLLSGIVPDIIPAVTSSNKFFSSRARHKGGSKVICFCFCKWCVFVIMRPWWTKKYFWFSTNVGCICLFHVNELLNTLLSLLSGPLSQCLESIIGRKDTR